MLEMPPVDAHFVNGGARPLGGMGEVGPVTVLPALTKRGLRGDREALPLVAARASWSSHRDSNGLIPRRGDDAYGCAQ